MYSIHNKSYKDILSELDSYQEYLQEMNAVANQVAWQKAKDSDTQKGYEEYMEQYPHGLYTFQATQKISELISKKDIIKQEKQTLNELKAKEAQIYLKKLQKQKLLNIKLEKQKQQKIEEQKQRQILQKYSLFTILSLSFIFLLGTYFDFWEYMVGIFGSLFVYFIVVLLLGSVYRHIIPIWFVFGMLSIFISSMIYVKIGIDQIFWGVSSATVLIFGLYIFQMLWNMRSNNE